MEETIFRQELQKRTTAIEDLLKQYLPAEEGYQKTVIELQSHGRRKAPAPHADAGNIPDVGW